jgi:hypothetical protein
MTLRSILIEKEQTTLNQKRRFHRRNQNYGTGVNSAQNKEK